jgi:hypothetical protein
MEMFEKASILSKSLEQFAEDLDISESSYLEAKKRYEGVGGWLGKDDSPLSMYAPEIYPQGSFYLGTMIKPITNKDEYDVDLVCFLAGLRKQSTSQEQLKKMVGDRLKANDTYKRLLDLEGHRCWVLNYANEFHMDILPAIADEVFRAQGGLLADAILITDTQKIANKDTEWPKSNPRGYAKWFQSRQEAIFIDLRKHLAESVKASVDDIPEYRVKTPLQRTIQILKRHRDIFYAKKKNDCKPISIIITTLAATLYKGQDNIYNAIYDILFGINENAVKQAGKFYIPNPANPGENFADKWDKDPSLPKSFFEWITDARSVFGPLPLEKIENMEFGKKLEESLGMKLRNTKAEQKYSGGSPVYVKVNSSAERRPWGSSCA